MPDDWLDEVAVPALVRAWEDLLGGESDPRWAANGGSTWSNLTTAPPLTLEVLREAVRHYTALVDAADEGDEAVEGDNVTWELLELVKRGDEAGFREMAGCVMPAGEVDECWCGVRARLGLSPRPGG